MAIEHEVTRETTVSSRTPVKMVENAAKALTGAFVGKGLCGFAAVVLAILGLAKLMPATMACVAAIVVGAALLWEGGVVLSQFNTVLNGANYSSAVRMEAGTLALFIGGGGGIVLAVLALLGIYPLALISIAGIAYGAALAVGSSVTSTIELALPWREKRPAQAFPGSRMGAAGLETMSGVGAIVLGILGLSGVAVMTLNLIAMLSVGAAALFAGVLTGSEFLHTL